jgi:Xaa-Pro aminopeptidase
MWGSAVSNQQSGVRITARFWLLASGVWLLILIQAAGITADDRSFFAARREALMKKIEGGIAVLEGAPETRAYTQFRQENDFYYLTGVEVPGAYLLIDAVQHRSILFLPPQDRRIEQWEGPRLFPGAEARAETGIDEALDIARLETVLENKRGAKDFYVPQAPYETAATSRDRAQEFESAQEHNRWDGRVPRAKAFAQRVRDVIGKDAALKDLSPILDSMRRVKDAQEIERLREAGRIGARGISEAMRSTKPGQFEYQIAAVAEFMFKWQGAMGYAFFPIVGSGPNSCVLHYSRNDRQTHPGDIVVMDFGPDYRYYQSDITRTFPVSGKFSAEQARVYRAVLEAENAALAKVRPGSTFTTLNDAAREVVNRAGYDKYWQHGVSHYLGMSTHDVGASDPFEAGVVVTVEPGIYIPEKELGVRIEDTVLVTPDGCEILTKGVPKEILDIEQLMSQPGIEVPLNR